MSASMFEKIKAYFHTITIRTFLILEGFGFLFSLSCVLGYNLDHKNTVCGSLGQIVMEFVIAIFASFAVCGLLLVGMYLQEHFGKKLGNRLPWGKEFSRVQVFFIYFGILVLCWFPIFLAYYPSVFAYDVEGQMYQVIAKDYSTHHPIIHTLFLGMFLKLGSALGNMNVGFAIHSLVQMLLMAAILAYALSYLYKEKTAAIGRIILLVFWSLFPTFSILVLSTTKDVLFSGLTLLFCICMCEFSKKEKLYPIEFTIVSVLMLLFRNNALYAYVLMLIIGIWFVENKMQKKFLLYSILAVVLTIGLNAGLKLATGAYNGSPREMLSIPIQQLARVRMEDYDTLSESEKAELEQFISTEWYYAYDAHLADPMKGRMKFDNPGGFVKLWIQLGMKHPGTYIDAFLFTTEGEWYLGDESYARIYGEGRDLNYGYLSTEMRTMPSGFEVTADSKLPGLKWIMEGIVSENQFLKVPVIKYIFHPALYVWIMLGYIAFSWIKRDKKAWIPVLFLLCYYLTLLLSPAVLVRYLFPYYLCMPVLLLGKKCDDK